jgi:predicted heme/steroid binding protein/uncharacterized membrane protein
MAEELKQFTREELRKHNGKDLPTIYVAHEGKVYDVTQSGMWNTGEHMGVHSPGADLTAEIGGAPHGPEVLERVPVVGRLVPEKDPKDERVPPALLRLFEKVPMLRRHPHPMTVHFPMAFNLAFPLFNILYVLTRHEPLETTAFHLLILCVPAMVVAMVTGPLSWWLNYGASMTRIIRVKFSVSVLLLILVLVALVWRIQDPDVLVVMGASGWVYLILSITFAPLVGALGWLGAKMTFPH